MVRPSESETPQVRQLRLEVSPADLGPLTLEIRHRGGEVTASVVVDHDRARQVVQQAEAQVRQSLANQGLQMGSFEVSCRGQGRGNEQLPQRQDEQARGSSEQSSAPPRVLARRVAEADPLTAVDTYA